MKLKIKKESISEAQEHRLQKDEGKVMRELEDLKRKFQIKKATQPPVVTQLNLSDVKKFN